MRFYRVRVRQWFPLFPSKSKAKKKPHWCDVNILLEAEDLDTAGAAGFDLAMAKSFFGADQAHCQVMETASVSLPHYL